MTSDNQYIPVSHQKHAAQQAIQSLKDQGYTPSPIGAFNTKKIATSFWGHAWCRHLEDLSDYQSRLPQGRSTLRNGSVCHLELQTAQAHAFVSDSEIYEITINLSPFPEKKWQTLKKQCTGKIGTLVDLLQGQLSDEVMALVTDPETGLFPSPSEIHLNCNCPDHADLCKHLAAVLYAIGRTLDTQPESLFLLRSIDHTQLINTEDITNLDTPSSSRRLSTNNLSNLFGVNIDNSENPEAPIVPPAPTPPPASPQKPKQPSKTKSKKAPPKPKTVPSLKTGNDIKKLRRTFGMSEYEFGLIMDHSPVTISEWESNKKSPHGASKESQTALDELAQLTPTQAQSRLNEYR